MTIDDGELRSLSSYPCCREDRASGLRLGLRAKFTGSRQTIAILLCTFNGGRYLPQFLESLAAQTHPDWRLIASDDGSSDHTLAILTRFAADSGKVEIRKGPGRGPTDNFLSLACDASLRGDYFAFADQDDVWHPGKLSRALSALAALPRSLPALYGSRTRITRSDNTPSGYSPLFAKAPSFNNALVQSLAGGNTMVFNRAAQALFVAAEGVEPVAHDWWAYQLIAGAGGHILYDPVPAIDYRQHGRNQVGSNNSWRARLDRAHLMVTGRFKTWNEINRRALRNVQHLLTPEHVEVLDEFCKLGTPSLRERIKALRRAGVYRQTFSGNVGLVAAAVLNKL